MKYYIATHENVNDGTVAPAEIFSSKEVDYITENSDGGPTIYFTEPGREPMPRYNLTIIEATNLKIKYMDESNDYPDFHHDSKFIAPWHDEEDNDSDIDMEGLLNE
jgi:hypothetical protein